MSSVNRVFLLGNLGRDPESKPVGDSGVCKFSLATSWTSGGKEDVAWHQIEAWGKTGELCQKYLKKGAKVCVEGRIRYSQWEKDGVKLTQTSIVADRVTFLSTFAKEDDKPKEPFAGMKVTKQSFDGDYGLSPEDVPF